MEVLASPHLGKLPQAGITFHEPIWNGYYFNSDGEHIEDVFLPKKWHHLCLSFNANFETISVMLVS